MFVVFLQIETNTFLKRLRFSLSIRHGIHFTQFIGATSSTDYRGWTDVFAVERRYTWDYFSIRKELWTSLCYIIFKEREKYSRRATKLSLTLYCWTMFVNINRIIGSYFVILTPNLNGNNQFYFTKLERNQHYHALPMWSAIIITVLASNLKDDEIVW